MLKGPCTSRRLAIAVGWYALWMAAWYLLRPAIFPSPFDVLGAFPALWTQDGLWQELIASLTVATEALALSAAIALPLAYLSRVHVDVPIVRSTVGELVRPLVEGISELRFLSPAVFYLMLLFLFSSGHVVKVVMLTMGETFFLITSMMDIVNAVPSERFDDCRTLRMHEWQCTWYAVVRGTLPDAIQAIRGNNAMGWAALMMVEGIVRSEGGVGVLILNNEKHMNFDSVWAIATTILVAGLVLDYAIELGKLQLCPHVAVRHGSA